VLSGLTENDVAQLIRHHAQEIGLDEMAQTKKSDVQTIYNLVGGNPLAIKLIVGLANILPLPQILEDLTRASLDKVEAMYRVVGAKFRQHPFLARRLVATGDRPLVEHGRDEFWGDGGDGSGRNWLGRLLVKIRAELRTTSLNANERSVL